MAVIYVWHFSYFGDNLRFGIQSPNSETKCLRQVLSLQIGRMSPKLETKANGLTYLYNCKHKQRKTAPESVIIQKIQKW